MPVCSFLPTRRSSDLEIEAYIDFFDYVFGRSSKRPEYEWKYVSSFAEWQEKSGASISVEDFPIRSDESMVNLDRKSTRLNSSHVANSYAGVFLKKKRL